jgi:outer membrane protein assembly factor BamB
MVWQVLFSGVLAFYLSLVPNVSVKYPVGWRTDGTGIYEAEVPPTHWSTEKNIIWKTPMPSWSNASAVIVGDRIFVCSEPTTLVCVNKKNGKILWQKTNTYQDTLTPDQAAKVQKDLEKADALAEAMKSHKKNLNALESQLNEKPDDPDIQKQTQVLKNEINKLSQELDAVSTYSLPSTHLTNGYSSCTPTSDGKHVYVLFGTGTVACYDLDGNRKWIRLIDKPKHEQGHSASPILVGDKLLVHIVDLFALDKNTGDILWRVPSKPAWGTPVHMRIDAIDVVITPTGDIVRVSDGTRLATELSSVEFCAPIVDDGRVYFIQCGGKALKLSPGASDTITAEELWKTKPLDDRYYASPVLHEGLIYAVTRANMFSLIDAKNGQVVYEKKLDLGKGDVFPSVTLAGRHLFVSNSNGTTLVLEPGREYKDLSKNTLEAFRSSPVFLGQRMYIRGLQNLYCIGQ